MAWSDVDSGVIAYKKGDYKTSFSELLPFAEKGNEKAQVYVGIMYGLGQGMKVDQVLAEKWLLVPARKGNNVAQLFLGMFIDDLVQSYAWYEMSFSNGNSDAAKFRDSVAKELTLAQIAESHTLIKRWKKKSMSSNSNEDTKLDKKSAQARSELITLIYDSAQLKLLILRLNYYTGSLTNEKVNEIHGKIQEIALKYNIDLNGGLFEKVRHLTNTNEGGEDKLIVTDLDEWEEVIVITKHGSLPVTRFKSPWISISTKSLNIQYAENSKVDVDGKQYVYRGGAWANMTK